VHNAGHAIEQRQSDVGKDGAAIVTAKIRGEADLKAC
jgi:hypothetical protein